MNQPRPWTRRPRREVFRHVRDLAEGRMTILISHRFSTVRMADEIVVLDGGRIVERGDHASLDGSRAACMRGCSSCRRSGYR